MKIAHISDSHLGYAQYNLIERKADFFKAFEQAIDRIIESNVDLVIHTGDLFESPQPDMISLSKAIKQFKKLKEKRIPVVAITGNHDRTLRKGKIPPQKILEDLGLLQLISPYGEKVFGDLYIAGIQFMPGSHLKELSKKIFPEFSENAVKHRFSIFMFHQGIDTYLPYEGAAEMSMSDLPEGFTYYAGGHIHNFIHETKSYFFSYAGVTEFRTVKEAESTSRGFNIIDLEKKSLERIKLENLRDFLSFTIEEGKDENVKLEEITEKASECPIPPIVVIKYLYTEKPFSETTAIKRLKEKALIVRVLQKNISEKETEKLKKTTSIEEIVRNYFKDQRKFVQDLSVELATSSTEHTAEILLKFLEEKTGLKITF
ncbi:exonuclease SbcCD subunit D [Desulfurobacterium sp.]|uniref:metallophosphoesterase family protein n=1 Tax=Desulfurobacterium sp. TaxID=2004706 RepID=UPI00262A1A1A|nr:exonuclease SbcCD subunit D [Desulfurobacterium sp.]